MNWRKLFEEMKALTQAIPKNAHRVATIMRELYNDRTFLKNECDDRPSIADEKLGEFSGRFALGPNDMVMMINYFPDLKDWENGRLDRLRDKAITQFNKERTVSMRSRGQGNGKANGKTTKRGEAAQSAEAHPQQRGPAAEAAAAIGTETPVVGKAAHGEQAGDVADQYAALLRRYEELVTENGRLRSELALKDAEIDRLKASLAGSELRFEQMRRKKA